MIMYNDWEKLFVGHILSTEVSMTNYKELYERSGLLLQGRCARSLRRLGRLRLVYKSNRRY